MAKHKLVVYEAVPAFHGRERDILRIGVLGGNPGSPGEGTGAEYRSIRRSALFTVAMVEMIQLRKWDHIFHISGAQVFIQFKNDDLLGPDAMSVADVIPYLREFEAWSNAMVSMHACGLEFGKAEGKPEAAARPESLRKEKDASRAIIDSYRRRSMGDGRSLHEIFLTCVRSFARMRQTTVTACALGGEPVEVGIPSRSRLPDDAQIRPETGNVRGNSLRYKVSAVEDGWLVVTSGGERYWVHPRFHGYSREGRCRRGCQKFCVRGIP